MKKGSITFKLFIITFLFFILFTSMTMLLQTLFIEKFYLNKKAKDFEANFQAFSAAYTDSVKNNADNSDIMSKFQNENNASTAIINLSGNTMRFFEDEKQFIVRIINRSTSTPDAMSTIVDNIITYNMDSKVKMLMNGLSQWTSDPKAVSEVVDEGQIRTYKSGDKIAGQNSLVGITPIIIDGEVIAILTAAASLQPIGEAATVIREFYIYFYAIALFLIFILSLIYSKMIAKPLLTLNKTALKMSELDFSTQCPVNSQDEIGNLSTTLNFLSTKLNSSLLELTAANEKLKEDIEKEKQLEVMRNDFIAGVSHELKTPISLISSYAEGIKDNITNGVNREYYSEIIIDETKKLASLVEDMLDLSQLKSGSYKLNVEGFPVINLLNSVVDRYMANAQLKGKIFDLQTPLNDLEVLGDMFRIEQVLTNLVDNAIKYTPVDCIIKIFVEDKGNKVLIEIENPGEHIPEAELLNIWSKFYRIEKSRNKDLGGTGLGLSIVKDILDLHGSEYGVMNTSYGVKFFFTLGKNQ